MFHTKLSGVFSCTDTITDIIAVSLRDKVHVVFYKGLCPHVLSKARCWKTSIVFLLLYNTKHFIYVIVRTEASIEFEFEVEHRGFLSWSCIFKTVFEFVMDALFVLFLWKFEITCVLVVYFPHELILNSVFVSVSLCFVPFSTLSVMSQCLFIPSCSWKFTCLSASFSEYGGPGVLKLNKLLKCAIEYLINIFMWLRFRWAFSQHNNGHVETN